MSAMLSRRASILPRSLVRAQRALSYRLTPSRAEARGQRQSESQRLPGTMLRSTTHIHHQPAPRLLHSTTSLRADKPFKLADIGEGITEVEVVKWLVKDGDTIEEFDALCEVQSDKSTVELTAPYSGIVKGIKFEEGETIKVGQVICSISTEPEDAEGSDLTHEITAATAEQPQVEVETVAEAPSAEEPVEADTAESVEQPQAEAQLQQQYVPIPPTEVDMDGQTHNHGSRPGENMVPPPPPRQIVRPTQVANESTSSMDRALLASMRAAAEAGDAVAAANEAVEHLSSQVQQTSWASAAAGSFSGEGGVVRQEAPKREVRTGPVPERQPREQEGREKEIVKASPAVRVMAARLGVKLEDVAGTGPDGRVTQQDVQNAVGRPPQAQASPPLSHATSGSPAPSPSSAAPTTVTLPPSPERSKIPEITKVEFGRTRKVMYRAMGDQAHVPHFGYSHTLNLTPLLPYMKALNGTTTPPSASYLASDIPATQARNPLSDAAKQKTTLLSFLVKGLLLAMEEHPIMRARAREAGTARFLDIARDGTVGVAVSDPKYGLVTPSLPRFPPSVDLSTITSALAGLRQNPTKPSSPANLTISSVGGLGEARGAMPVLPPGGGLAICAVGKARWEVEWKKGKSKTMDWLPEDIEAGGTEAVLKCPVGWSGDHRVLEGAELIAFTETWKRYIEEPWRWITIK